MRRRSFFLSAVPPGRRPYGPEAQQKGKIVFSLRPLRLCGEFLLVPGSSVFDLFVEIGDRAPGYYLNDTLNGQEFLNVPFNAAL